MCLDSVFGLYVWKEDAYDMRGGEGILKDIYDLKSKVNVTTKMTPFYETYKQ